MKLTFKKKSYNFKNKITILEALFSINPSINKEIFCKEGRCKSCYCQIMQRGSFQANEVLACKTRLKNDIIILSCSKSLNK